MEDWEHMTWPSAESVLFGILRFSWCCGGGSLIITCQLLHSATGNAESLILNYCSSSCTVTPVRSSHWPTCIIKARLTQFVWLLLEGTWPALIWPQTCLICVVRWVLWATALVDAMFSHLCCCQQALVHHTACRCKTLSDDARFTHTEGYHDTQ